MIRPILVLATLSVSLGLLGNTAAGTHPSRPGLSATVAAELAGFQQSPELAGPRVYEGAVAPLDPRRPDTLFRYERRVRPDGAGLSSTHITRDPSGAVVVVQRAWHDEQYGLERAEMIHAQTGAASSVRVTGRQLEFRLEQGGRVSTARETGNDPVVAGPTMFGFILAHWDELVSGQKLRIRFAVLERKQAIGFELERVRGRAGVTTIRMKPTSFVVGLVVAPTRFDFDSASRHILGYAGRVPPLERVNGRLRTLDARVSYAFSAAEFR